MNPATKAALFSALLFPGWGQIYLKKYKRGIIIMLPVIAGIISFCWIIIQMTVSVLKAFPLKKDDVNFGQVVIKTIDSLKSIDWTYSLLILMIIVIFWIFSVIDAYILGKKAMSVSNTSADQQSASPPV